MRGHHVKVVVVIDLLLGVILALTMLYCLILGERLTFLSASCIVDFNLLVVLVHPLSTTDWNARLLLFLNTHR